MSEPLFGSDVICKGTLSEAILQVMWVSNKAVEVALDRTGDVAATL